MSESNTILVTGGAGFIGSALIRYLINETSHKVINVDKLTYAGDLQSLASIAKSTRYSFEHVDICNKPSLMAIFKKYQPDKIMHLAAESHVDRSINSADIFIDSNIIGTFTLLEVVRAYWQALEPKKQALFRFHHVSTDEVYGDLSAEEAPFTETASYAPSSPYSASKAGSDHLVKAWGRTYGLPFVMTHTSNNYGPYQYPEKLIPLMILNAMVARPLPIYGEGVQIRDWLYVDDHVKGLYCVLMKGCTGETYNIGASNEKRNIEVVKCICDLLEELVPTRHNRVGAYQDLIRFIPDRLGHDQRYAIDNKKIVTELGWQAEESFESGLRKTVQWYLTHSAWVDHIQQRIHDHD